MTQVTTRPDVLELAQLLRLEYIAYCRRQNLMVADAPWIDLPPVMQGQLLAFADCARLYAALDRLPIEAIDVPIPVPPARSFLDRLATRAEAEILDRTVWIWLYLFFCMGRLL